MHQAALLLLATSDRKFATITGGGLFWNKKSEVSFQHYKRPSSGGVTVQSKLRLSSLETFRWTSSSRIACRCLIRTEARAIDFKQPKNFLPRGVDYCDEIMPGLSVTANHGRANGTSPLRWPLLFIYSVPRLLSRARPTIWPNIYSRFSCDLRSSPCLVVFPTLRLHKVCKLFAVTRYIFARST